MANKQVVLVKYSMVERFNPPQLDLPLSQAVKSPNSRVEIEDPKDFLRKLRVAVPFLQKIPDERYFNFDTAEFHLPQGKVANARTALEQTLGQNIMTYNRDIFRYDIPVTQHLCANLAGAALTEEQLQMLQEYEGRFSEDRVSFVAYKKPAELIDPNKSGLYKSTLIYNL
jgi:hypothetical protein